MAVMYVVFPGFGLVGVFVLVLGIRTGRTSRRRHRSWHRVSGEVIGYKRTWLRNHPSSHVSDGGFVNLPRVRYRAPDGTEREFVNQYGSNAPVDPTGQQVTVLVNPADPADALVAGPVRGGGCLASMYIALGTVFAFLGAIGTAGLVLWKML